MDSQYAHAATRFILTLSALGALFIVALLVSEVDRDTVVVYVVFGGAIIGGLWTARALARAARRERGA